MLKLREVIEKETALTFLAGPNGPSKTVLVEDYSREVD
jgi:predicted ATPase